MSRSVTEVEMMPTIADTAVPMLDALARLKELETDNWRLRDLVQHCSVHAAYANCGYPQMDSEQQALYDDVVGHHSLALRFAGVPTAPAGTLWRYCEFCQCKTNARERICCTRGRDSDRRTWDRSGLT